MNKEDFIQGLIYALNDDSVLTKLNDTICHHLKFDLKKLTDASKNVQNEMKKLKETSTQLGKEVSELRNMVLNKDKEISDLKKKVVYLESDIDRQEQYTRRNSIRIMGLKKHENENISERVINLFNKKMSVVPPVTEEMIERVHRAGPATPSKNRGVLVKFSSFKVKQRVYAQSKSLKVKDGQKKDSIFINEDLTRRRATLFWKAGKLKNEKRLDGCWTYNGTLMILDKNNKVLSISDESDLQKKI